MIDPVMTATPREFLENLAERPLADACKRQLNDKFKTLFGWLESLG